MVLEFEIWRSSVDLRSSAQVISYEIALALSLVGIMVLSGPLILSRYRGPAKTLGMECMSSYSFPPISCFSSVPLLKPTGPHSILPEAESELVAGYFVEYSGMILPFLHGPNT